MEIRPLRDGDLAAVAGVQARAMVASPIYAESVDVVSELARLLPRVAGYFRGTYHPSHALEPRAGFVALANGGVVGFAAGHLSTRMGCEAELQWTFVLPRWQRRGIGGALLEPLAAWFVRHGARRVVIDAPPENPCRAFYLAHGARELDGYWLFWSDVARDLRGSAAAAGPGDAASLDPPGAVGDHRRDRTEGKGRMGKQADAGDGFRSDSITLEGKVSVPAPVDDAFPLFSPEGERWWVDGWDPEYLHPADGTWQQGQLFRTREESGEAVWVVTRLDRGQHRAEYHRVEPGRWVARVRVDCRATGAEATEVSIAYSYFGLSEAGNREIAAMSREEYEAKMVLWSGWIERYLASA